MLNLAKLRTLLDARQPNHSLPQDFYTDPEVFAFDLEAIYSRTWLLIGFEPEVAAPGASLALTIGRTPIVVVRGKDGALRGFYNSCRHRGSQICPDGHATQSWLICPYHQWSYALDGTLANAPFMPAGFDKSGHGLRPIHVETVAGAIYICLADEPPAFAPFRDQIGPLLAPHNLANAKLAYESTLLERANWKLVMENARECYHCTARHPELSRTFPANPRKVVQFADSQRFDRFRTRMEAAGLPTGPVEGPWWQAMRFPVNEGATTLSMDGKPACTKLMCDAEGGDIGTMRWALEPHCFAHATADVTFLFSALPIGPEETVVVAKWLVHKDAVEGVDYRVEDLIDLWTVTNLQDRDLCETNQRGVNSRGYVPGPYNTATESLVIRFVDWYCAEVEGYLDQHANRPRLAAVS